jgi:hypothetical protein
MRPIFVVAAVALLSSPAFAESFNISGAQILTHRGSNIVLTTGNNDLDKDNKLTCTSDNGCSLVIQTQTAFLFPGRQYSYNICTFVDGVAAAPPCKELSAVSGFLTTFQGAPALGKGDHRVTTTIQSPNDNVIVTGFQLVYTLYQHQ